MKKIFIFFLSAVLLISFTGCSKDTDALKFKKEYEDLNNTENGNHKIRSVSISKDNPIIYKSANDIVKMIDNNETFVVYFGFPTCPWCRSMLEVMLKVAKDNKISKLYYVNVYDIRDTKEINNEGKIETTKEGSKGYYALLEKLDNLLADYTLTNENEEEISAEEKRIYAPNVVAVVNGKPTKLAEGISEKQEDPYGKLTDEMKDDMYEQLECVFKCLNEKTTCTKNGC